MENDRQNRTPFFTKLKEYGLSKTIPFDVPGHKLGRIENDMMAFTGINTFLLDSNAPIGLDHLSKPQDVIKEAQELMAEACKADQSYFLINGTTVGILAMIMTVVRAKEKIILPRNVHKSIINGLILSGAMPVFIKPEIDHELGIANGIRVEAVKEAIQNNPDAKAVFVINPTYFGITSDLQAITDLAHEHGMLVLVDEAHGSHLYFNTNLPLTAMEAGADCSATSFHKTGGSLTQSSVLLTKGTRIDHNRLLTTLNMLQSTSPNSLLLASIDVARKELYFHGQERIDNLIVMADNARERIQTIPGITILDKNYVTKCKGFDFDETKLVIRVSDIGLTGFDVLKEMFHRYHIQLELAESHLILAVLTIGSLQSDLDSLYLALKDLSKRYYKLRNKLPKIKFTYEFPETYTRPRDAYHAPKLIVPLKDAVNEISAESIMIYPPGIPMVIPGEVISQGVLEDIDFYIKNGSVIMSELNNGMFKIVDKANWKYWEGDEDEV